MALISEISSISSLSSPRKLSFIIWAIGLPARFRVLKWCMECQAELGGAGNSLWLRSRFLQGGNSITVRSRRAYWIIRLNEWHSQFYRDASYQRKMAWYYFKGWFNWKSNIIIKRYELTQACVDLVMKTMKTTELEK